MARVVLERATVADGRRAPAAPRAEPMDGSIRVAFEREPSYFGAARVQGRVCQVILGRDAEHGRGDRRRLADDQAVFVNGRARDVGYLSDLRVLPPIAAAPCSRAATG